MQRPLAVCLAVLGCVSCEVIGQYETFEAQAVDLPAEPHPCDDIDPSAEPGKGESMVLIKESDGGCFWLDKTEVTVDQYRSFLSDSEILSWTADESEASCSDWKATPSNPEQDAQCIEQTLGEDDPFQRDKPVRCVDWCDALAFCKWAGKELCGSEVVVTNTMTSLRRMYWGLACSEGGGTYPYGGDEPDAGACNIGFGMRDCINFLMGACGPAAVPTALPLHCESPRGAVDMIGNVAEWVASCGKLGPVQEQTCTIRGGSFADDGSVTCQTVSKSAARSARSREIGFRCCASER